MKQVEHRMFTMRPAGAARAVMYMLIAMLDEDQVGPRVARMLVERAARGDSVPPFYIMLAGQALAARGHLKEALMPLRAATALRAQLFALGLDPAGSPDSVVAQWVATTTQVAPLLDLLPWLARRGDTLAIARLEREVSQRAGPPGAPAAQYGPLVAPAIRTYAALARNDTASAFRILQSTPDSVCVALCQEMQLIKARLLRERGRNAEAQALLNLEWPDLSRIGYTLLMLERGRVADAMNQREAAIDAYSYAVQGWGAGDSLAQQVIAPAREGLRRLGVDERVGRPVKR
jgi:tetratricopeptide (TPR) repeat protein